MCDSGPTLLCSVCAQYKTSEVASRCKSLMRVNIYKNRIKNAAHLPALPNAGSLLIALSPSYSFLSNTGENKDKGKEKEKSDKGEKEKSTPLYAISDEEKHAADAFLQVLSPCS